MTASARLPPDRGHLSTERRHNRSIQLDALDSRALVQLMIDDHRSVAEALARAAPGLAAFIDELAGRMRAGGRLIYVGAGTSGRLGVLDAAECPPTFQSDPSQIVGIIAGGDAAMRRSSEGMEDDPRGARAALAELGLSPRDTVLGIAAGGTTPYVLGALRIAKACGVATALLTCAASRDAPEGCDLVIHIDTGPELLTGSTRLKAGSATKLALNIISTALFVQLGKVYSNLMVDLRASNDKLLDRAIRILIELCPDLDRPNALKLLQAAGNQLKPAILMHKRSLTLDQALARLAQAKGALRAALQP